MKGGTLWAVALWWTWCNVAGAQAPAPRPDADVVVVEMRPSSVVDSGTVTIEAMAEIRGGEPWLRQQIGRLDLAELPQIGRAVGVAREQVIFRIQLAGIDSKRFRVEGAALALVTQPRTEWTEQDVEAAAERAIVQRLGADPRDVQFRLVQPVRLPAVAARPGDGLQFVPDIRTPGCPLGRVRVEVAVLDKGERLGAVPVILEVACFQQVAVATRRLEPGETLVGDLIHSERMLVHGGDSYVAFAENLSGQRTLRGVPAGQVLTSADLEAAAAADPVLVKKGDSVKLVANVSNISVTTVGEALQDGRAGQTIRVRNIDSGRIVVGRVTDRALVEVER